MVGQPVGDEHSKPSNAVYSHERSSIALGRAGTHPKKGRGKRRRYAGDRQHRKEDSLIRPAVIDQSLHGICSRIRNVWRESAVVPP